MLMAKGKMGERVSEDAQLKLTDLVVDYGYKAGFRVIGCYRMFVGCDRMLYNVIGCL